MLVYGFMPRTPFNTQGLPEQMSRMCAMRDARDEIQQLSSRTRLHVSLSLNVPRAAYKYVRAVDEVLMYGENPIGKWVGPYIFTSIDGKYCLWTRETGRLAHRSTN